MAQRDHRGMTTARAPVFRLERLNLTMPNAAHILIKDRTVLQDPAVRAALAFLVQLTDLEKFE